MSERKNQHIECEVCFLLSTLSCVKGCIKNISDSYWPAYTVKHQKLSRLQYKGDNFQETTITVCWNSVSSYKAISTFPIPCVHQHDAGKILLLHLTLLLPKYNTSQTLTDPVCYHSTFCINFALFNFGDEYLGWIKNMISLRCILDVI